MRDLIFMLNGFDNIERAPPNSLIMFIVYLLCSWKYLERNHNIVRYDCRQITQVLTKYRKQLL